MSEDANTFLAFKWDSNNGMQELPSFDEDNPFSFATGINDHGHAVGYSGVDFTSIHSAMWVNGAIIDLGDLPGGQTRSYAQAVNNNGQVAGWSNASTGDRGYLWENGVLTDLGDLAGGSDQSRAFDINSSGQVVGFGTGGSGRRAVLWENGTINDLGVLQESDNQSFAYGINDLGGVVGQSGDSSSAREAFIWEDGVMKGLGQISNGSLSLAYDINNLGQVVGIGVSPEAATQNGQTAFLWDEVNGTRDLNDLIDESANEWVIIHANAINDSGQIIGWGRNPDGKMHAFIMTQAIPEPGAISILGVISLGVLGRRRRWTR
jgi:probable HAF family extracellular repeat protein